MDIILIKKKGKTKIIFYSDKVQKYKKEKLIFEVKVFDIKHITYNYKFSFKDFMCIILFAKTSGAMEYFRNSLVLRNKEKPVLVSLKLSKNEYEILKEKFNKSIELI